MNDSGDKGFSSVILTLLSLVVALAIEQLLGQVTTQFQLATGQDKLLIAAQGIMMFVAIGAIWTVYITMILTGSWTPRFQDFFAPLALLCTLYIAILLIGGNISAWFGVAALGWANAFYGPRYALPSEVARAMNPKSSLAWRAHWTNLILCLLGMAGAIATFLGDVAQIVLIAFIILLSCLQLLGAWFQFRWWQSTQNRTASEGD